MQDTRNGLRVGEHAGDLTHRTVGVDSVKLASVHVGIPIGHVDDEIVILHARVGELREEAAGVQVVVILVDLAHGLADLKVGLEVVHPMALRAVDRNTTVGAFEVRMGRRLAGLVGRLSRFRVVRRDRGAGLLVARVRTKSILLDECGPLADRRRGRVREGVEQVVGFQERSRIDGGSG